MKPGSVEYEDVTNAILRRLVADQAEGRVLPLEAYLELWPDCRALVTRILRQQVDGLEVADEEVGRQFASYVLEKEPDRRYQTARDLAEDLRRVRQNEPILARRPGLVVRTLRWSRRNPALAALVIVLVAGVVTFLALLSSERLAR